MSRVLIALLLVLVLVRPGLAGHEFVTPQGKRSYELLGAKPGQPRPLILALHGNLGTGAQFATYAGWAQFAAANDVVVALPDGLNRAWADGRAKDEVKGKSSPAGTDDVAFLGALVEHLVAAKIADRRRIYATGISNGGMMVYRLLCERADLFAAGAAVVAVMTDGAVARCAPDRPVPMLIMNGTVDRFLPWARDRTYVGTEATVAHFAKLNRCAGQGDRRTLPDLDAADGSVVIRIDYRCPPASDVVLYRVEGGGHQWPSRASRSWIDRFLGPRNRDIEAADEIWQFFKRFSR